MKRILIIISSSLVWLLKKLTRRQKLTNCEPFDEAFFLEMETAAANERIGLNVPKGLFIMSTQFYNEYLCDGPMTMLNDPKAHKFFHKLRQWINIHRGLYNGEAKAKLECIKDFDTVCFGVFDAENNLYIIGKENPNLLFVSYTNTKTDEGDSQK